MGSIRSDDEIRPVTVTEAIGDLLQCIQTQWNGADAAVILIGSYARSAATADSDIDVLVIADRANRLSRPRRLHVQVFSVEAFRARLRDRDDLALWAVRYGVPLRPSAVWANLVATPEAGGWPTWERKVEHAMRRLVLGADMLDIGDVTAAREELLYAVSHVGRGLLLRKGVFPLSRPEMILQLREIDQNHLSRLLNVLVYGDPTTGDLRRTVMYIKKLLVSLDRDQVQRLSRERSANRTAKRARAAEHRRAVQRLSS